MQAGAGNLANRIQPRQSRRTIEVSFDSAALIMRCRHNRDCLLRHVDPEPQACLVNMWETLPNEFRRLVCDVQKHTFRT